MVTSGDLTSGYHLQQTNNITSILHQYYISEKFPSYPFQYYISEKVTSSGAPAAFRYGGGGGWLGQEVKIKQIWRFRRLALQKSWKFGKNLQHPSDPPPPCARPCCYPVQRKRLVCHKKQIEAPPVSVCIFKGEFSAKTAYLRVCCQPKLYI